MQPTTSMNYDVTNVLVSESSMCAEPTQREINKVLDILKDFCVVPKNVPKFRSRAHLEQWRHTLIEEALA